MGDSLEITLTVPLNNRIVIVPRVNEKMITKQMVIEPSKHRNKKLELLTNKNFSKVI